MDRTETKDGIITVGKLEFTGLMIETIKAYRFTHKGESPAKIILPKVEKVEGVTIEIEEAEYAHASGKTKKG